MIPGIHLSLPAGLWTGVIRLTVQQATTLVIGGDASDSVLGRTHLCDASFSCTVDPNIINLFRVVVQYYVGFRGYFSQRRT